MQDLVHLACQLHVLARLFLLGTYEEISTSLNIAQNTARRIYTLFEVTGDVSPKHVKDKPYLRRRDHHLELFIIGIILEKLSIYISELCQLTYDVSGVCVCQKLLYVDCCISVVSLGRK